LSCTKAARKKRAGFHVVHSHGYIEIALGLAAAAMLPPLLAVRGVPALTIWQWSSAIIAVGFAAHTYYNLERSYRIIGWRFPVHVWINTIVTVAVIAALVANTIGVPLKPDVGPIAVAATWRLVMAIEIFLADFGRISLTRVVKPR
jgi:hypothetical protein